ncbi:MAG: TIGR02996 domain-containing protein [Deltaproteobacteria bacterium]|nr:TIGR02996 domain-containing protein [Deltaproteobacteria bacterium]
MTFSSRGWMDDAAATEPGSKGPAVELRDPELEAVLLADPDARGGYAVYADWLLERDDPRGELISVQFAREVAPEDAAWLAHLAAPLTWLHHPFVSARRSPRARRSRGSRGRAAADADRCRVRGRVTAG